MAKAPTWWPEIKEQVRLPREQYLENCECGEPRYYQIVLFENGPRGTVMRYWHGENPESAIDIAQVDSADARIYEGRNLYSEWIDRIHAREAARG